MKRFIIIGDHGGEQVFTIFKGSKNGLIQFLETEYPITRYTVIENPEYIKQQKHQKQQRKQKQQKQKGG